MRRRNSMRMRRAAAIAMTGAITLAAIAGCTRTGDRPVVAHDPCAAVGKVPDDLRARLSLDAFYVKHVDAGGLPVLASGAPSDAALARACTLVGNLLSKRPDVRAQLVTLEARFAVIGRDEGTSVIPEYGFRERPQSDRGAVDAHARGLGGQVGSCGEENLMCLAGDRYRGESICVHEFAHTIRHAVDTVDPTFPVRLQQAFDAALAAGTLDGTYRRENLDEYWAEGVQDWYDTNAVVPAADGVHGPVHSRAGLRAADPALHALIAEVLPEDTAWGDCNARQ